MRPQLSSPGTLERGAGTVYRGTDPPNFKPAPETAAFEPRVSPPNKPETYPWLDQRTTPSSPQTRVPRASPTRRSKVRPPRPCLLYPSDAADDKRGVDLGG